MQKQKLFISIALLLTTVSVTAAQCMQYQTICDTVSVCSESTSVPGDCYECSKPPRSVTSGQPPVTRATCQLRVVNDLENMGYHCQRTTTEKSCPKKIKKYLCKQTCIRHS
ncbi:MAG: hypothetical protein A3I77_07510 [Gammaproteobacteria bacterium RIFCSPLOWO2_02_FULL_42_14]|nr:MAG: hypothetical protein A3B71_03340 [Gammaproteobacteria bacterium RIFCSPHIGHO2_02_FULL_42_43]OGT29503.1 MAG: hypothetical protein A2624_02480 [Gammaproteobacteria bacterium RIFCSPHIGHO2_01_FULL_42_8]OGT53028.1 MAG: hypothetical protein A3E54_08185 [Gammaproteobacteria bacterium RIFCSPHIGHO2_12_FULL_41_25]OGT61199.1 MAG: hypothetical protein A3I77_07510 [Gammaproteobacteria bacterium RIFCSPLOWO2_02_FULL_42_14]OGT87126.1 MAG: hypothetical protein A3G86_01230 [Gammaproteobacteria bacterium R